MSIKLETQLKVRAYYNVVQIQEIYTSNLFIEYLDNIYIDFNKVERTLNQLHHIKQRERKSFVLFFLKFERILIETQISIESNRTKISFLESILNNDIRRAIIEKTRSIYILFAIDL